MFRRCFVLFLVSALSLCVVISADDELHVTMGHGGSLIGTNLVSEKGRNIRSFLGIPYAKPPVGPLRFESPVPFPAWKGIKNATKDGSSCPQSYPLAPNDNVQGNEDCLYLNVYTPPLSFIPKNGLSVMVWIHGGAWLGGSNYHLFYGPDYLMDHNIILVTINYRLGPLGFLSTETLDCPGNFGLKDQVEALRWVNEHISSFGGNPESITIFGESAGGASISYLLQSEKPKGLFHRAIQQSGTIFNSWAQPLHKGVAQKRALKMAQLFSCDDDEGDWKKMITCLKQVDFVEMTAQTKEFVEWNGYPYFVFQPVLEPKHKEAFLDVRPRDGFLNSLDIPILTGITSGEGILSTASILSNEELLNDVKTNYKKRFPLMLSFDHWDEKKQKEITENFLEFYLKNGHVYDKSNHQNITDMFSDSLFAAGFDEYLEKRLSGKSAPTYVYVYDFASKNSISKFVGGGDYNFGVCHGDDIEVFFPIHKLFGLERSSDTNFLTLKDALLKMWVNFAVEGNPTTDNKFEKWEPTRKYPWNYARLGGIDDNGWFILKNEVGYATDRFRFWKSLRPHDENERIGHTEL